MDDVSQWLICFINIPVQVFPYRSKPNYRFGDMDTPWCGRCGSIRRPDTDPWVNHRMTDDPDEAVILQLDGVKGAYR